MKERSSKHQNVLLKLLINCFIMNLLFFHSLNTLLLLVIHFIISKLLVSLNWDLNETGFLPTVLQKTLNGKNGSNQDFGQALHTDCLVDMSKKSQGTPF